MKRMLAALTMALLVCTAVTAVRGDEEKDKTKPGKVTVKGTSLQINQGLDKELYGGSYTTTMLNLEVRCPGKFLLGVVDPSSKVTEFKDDKDTDLLRKGFGMPNFTSYGGVARNLSAMIVSVSSSTSPARGASKLRLKGNLVLVTGTDEKTTDAQEVEFKDKAEVKFGNFTLKVDREKPFFGEGGAIFSIHTNRPIVKSVTVKDGDGKEVEVQPLNRFGFFKNWTANFSLKKSLKKGKVTVTYFSKEEKLTVPVDLDIGVGL